MNLEIINPYQENNNYVFDIKSNSEQLLYQPKRTHKLHKYENKMSISICDKIDLQYFDSLRSNLINILYEQQDKWFEDKFSEKDLESMFHEYLRPNFRENSIDLQCLFSDQFHSKLGNERENCFTLEIYPTFIVQSIKFDGKKFYISILCNDFELKNMNNNKEETQESDDEVSLERELEEEEPLKKDELEEVEVDKENLENMDMSLSEDDYYIVYKTINQEIKNNIVDSLHQIFESKGINVGDLNLSDIVYDSDSDSDSDSDDSENDFEENYKDMIS